MREVPCTLENRNVASLTPLLAPSVLHDRLPLDASSAAGVAATRAVIADIIAGRDPRFMVIVGPCSIHDMTAAREYLERLVPLATTLATTASACVPDALERHEQADDKDGR